MDYDHKKVDKVGKVIVDSLLLVLLWAILALPVSTFSLIKLDTSGNDVLSGQNAREVPVVNKDDQTKTVRDLESNTGDLIERINSYSEDKRENVEN